MERSLARPTIALPRFRPLGAVAGLLHRPRVLLWRHRRVRLALLALLIALPLLAGGWLLFRHSSFVAVQRVQITGVHGAEAEQIEAALMVAARHMSTLDVHPRALEAAVARYQVVRSVRAYPSFPHGLRLQVVEQLPVAALLVDGSRTAVAADGVVLGPVLLSGTLPTVGSDIEPAQGRLAGGAGVRAALTILGAAPAPLARRVKRVFLGPEGLTVQMRNGLLVYFGDASRPHAKWLSLARVLADPSSAGASDIDVRLPARPAAGFADGVAPTTADGAAASTSSSSTVTNDAESTVAALAANLSEGGASQGSTPSTAGESPGSGLSTAGASPSAPSSTAPSPAQTGGAATAPEASPPSATAGTPAGGTEASSTPAGTAGPEQ